MFLSQFHLIEMNEMKFLTNVYGPKKPLEKIHFLNSTQALHPLIENDPWITGGDFNIIISLEEN